MASAAPPRYTEIKERPPAPPAPATSPFIVPRERPARVELYAPFVHPNDQFIDWAAGGAGGDRRSAAAQLFSGGETAYDFVEAFFAGPHGLRVRQQRQRAVRQLEAEFTCALTQALSDFAVGPPEGGPPPVPEAALAGLRAALLREEDDSEGGPAPPALALLALCTQPAAAAPPPGPKLRRLFAPRPPALDDRARAACAELLERVEGMHEAYCASYSRLAPPLIAWGGVEEEGGENQQPPPATAGEGWIPSGAAAGAGRMDEPGGWAAVRL